VTLILIFQILFFLAAFFLVALILLQESKGGGITAVGISGVENIIGARNPLRKLTVGFTIAFVILILAIGVSIIRAQQGATPVIPAPTELQPAVPGAATASTGEQISTPVPGSASATGAARAIPAAPRTSAPAIPAQEAAPEVPAAEQPARGNATAPAAVTGPVSAQPTPAAAAAVASATTEKKADNLPGR
jgi:preprotein translocase subunit SecG